MPYLQARCYAQGYATAVITVADGNVSVGSLKYTDITAKPDALTDKEENLKKLDETVLDISYVAWNAAWEEMSEVLGIIDTPVRKSGDVGANTAGNWLTGLLLEGTKEYGTVAAFYNNGGIRTNFTIPAGEKTRLITANDIYTIAPFGNTVLMYDITGKELAKQLAGALAHSNLGDQVSGLKYTYRATGNEGMDRADRTYTILGITLDDGREVDINDDKTLYRVCITNYSSTLPGSVFEHKTPVIPEAEAPADHELLVEVLRKLRDAGDGHIPVDTGERGREVK
jgi:2',3'-cyclic-nucleotide 2'-phosphodiesterase (5'-nucleotidase family)